MLTLEFKRDCPTAKFYRGDTIRMSVAEYKALSEQINSETKKPLDARINHTKIIEGAELLKAKPQEDNNEGPKAPSQMSKGECKAELAEKEIQFDDGANLTELRALVKESRA